MNILFPLIRKISCKTVFATSVALILLPGWNKISAQELTAASQNISAPVISKVALLSIHVTSIELHDSVYHFLTDKLGLPVDYYPLIYAGRRYCAVHVGNLYLEPCGPFTTFTYASKNFKAIFFGLNCGSDRSLSSVTEELKAKRINIKEGDVIEVTDSSLIRPNIYFAIAAKATPEISDDSLHTVMLKKKNDRREDSLRSVLSKNNRDALGIEKVKEIRVGYKDNAGLKKWKELIKPSVLSNDGVWKLNEGPPVRFVKSDIREVNSIVIKVKSLKKAQSYLLTNNLPFSAGKNEISLDKSRTFGLSILFAEK